MQNRKVKFCHAVLVTGIIAYVMLGASAWGQGTGVAYFALLSSKFPCDDALRVFEKDTSPALSILWGTFGNDTSCLTKWFNTVSARPHVLEIHLINQPCRRRNRCGDGELYPSFSVAKLNLLLEGKDPAVLEGIRERVKAIRTYVDSHASSKGEYILSTGLEDNYTNKAYGVVRDLVRSEWPYKIVRNPEGDCSKVSQHDGADYIECHGSTPQFVKGTPCIANLDGEDMVFPHRNAVLRNRVSWDGVSRYVENLTKQCRVTFLWSAPWQGIESDNFILPQERTLKVTAEDVVAVQTLARSSLSKKQ